MPVCSVPACDTPPYVYMCINIILLSYVDSFKHLKLTSVRVVRTLFIYSPFFYLRCSRCEENDMVIKTSLHGQYVITVNASVIIGLYTLFQALIFNTKVYNWQLYADIIRHIFRIRIFNFSIRLVWLNTTYIIPNFCRAIL